MKDDPDTNVQFVQTIESYPCIYNRQSTEYSNKIQQDETWKEIGKKFDATVFECKERWKNLRACFSRHLKVKVIPGSPAVLKKPYYLANHLNFLIPFTKSRNQIGYTTSKPSKNESREKEELTDYYLSENEQDNNEFAKTTDDINDTNNQNSSDTNFTQPDLRLLTASVAKPVVKNKRRWTDLGNVVKTFNKKRKIGADEEDLDLCFFKSILPDIRQMNLDQKRRFKVGIINLSGTILNEQAPTLPDYNRTRHNREYLNIESRPNSRLSTLSSNSSLQIEYKVKEEIIE